MLSGLSLSLKTQPKLTILASGGSSTSSYVLLAIRVEILVLQASFYLLASGEFITAL